MIFSKLRFARPSDTKLWLDPILSYPSEPNINDKIIYLLLELSKI